MTLIDNNARVILIITMAYFKIERRITCSDKKKSQVKKEKLKIHFQLQLAFVVMTNNNLKIKPCNNEYSNNDCISIEKYFFILFKSLCNLFRKSIHNSSKGQSNFQQSNLTSYELINVSSVQYGKKSKYDDQVNQIESAIKSLPAYLLNCSTVMIYENTS
jgi:hypothetical protein